MSTAILTGTPVPGSSVEADLRSLGFEVRVVEGAEEAERAIAESPCEGRVALVDARFVGHVHALRLALTDPRFPLSAVPGAVTARPDARAALTRALARETSAGGRTAIAVDSVADRVVQALDAEGTPPHRPALGSLVAVVPQDPQARNEARQAVAAVDDEAVRLKSSVKSGDGFFTTFFISPYSRHLARWCARHGLTPNQVTTASLLTALIAAGCAATGTRGGFVAAGLLLIVSFVLDCTDGQLARYALKYSTLGAWLDATFDRAKEYAYYAGLALGAARGGDDVWALALAAMVLQSVRHMVDFAYHEAEDDVAPPATGPVKKVGLSVWIRRMIILPIGERWAMIAVLTAVATPRITFYALLIGCAFAAAYTTAGRVARSVRRRTPNTDRSAQALADMADNGALATLLAPLLRGRTPRTGPLSAALGAVLVVAASAAWEPDRWTVLLAGVYVLLSAEALAHPLSGSLAWLVVPLFRTAEYTTVLLLAAQADVNGALPAAFGLVGAVAYHHYDTVYRIRGGAGAPPAWLVRAIGGQEGRTLLVCVLAALLDGKPFTLALTALAVAVALLVLVESIRFWVAAHKAGAPAVHDEGELA
ncbi:DUF5941 domain-containing protein [Streptomyces acidiscabies]|uniref:DUF5941 domain-containing protein n=2 Tax=Streptomyces acidiscabies TaxID=42234 RepID=A0AAP6BAB8_9ACTN|nr:DUF5941 domain-containing protein [Streptomyces acidiscabies]MBZ3916536.1 CDP-alcohol phosphatidyltransferase family protein [Streptomyces acidiscabies]MDX2961091.1 DUF5941 domain-containing protein [Streptomyces acidiscabies]MDX3020212.1 DUF5941 domain-containing protein [Streptomyces acidiscabies]MDX3791798.1 DUF5941 domain-containing protein [Streptomyces acidiscabies]GAV44428.1 bifunctional IPC transferase and DIPP synthase [Streptomyces acidiscabies]